MTKLTLGSVDNSIFDIAGRRASEDDLSTDPKVDVHVSTIEQRSRYSYDGDYSSLLIYLSLMNFFYRSIFIASLGGLLFGYDTGIISGALLFIKKDFNLTLWQSEILVASALFGAALGALGCGVLTNNFSRRVNIFISALFFACGSLGCWLSPDFLWLVSSRILVGMGVGITSYVTPLYIAEISLSYHRGRYVGLNTIAVTGGIVLAYLVNDLLVFTHSWRLMLGLGIIPALILLIGCAFLPESSRWLIKNKYYSEALATLTKLHCSTEAAHREYQDIVHHQHMHTTSWQQLFQPKYRKMLTLGLSLALIQQFSGINAILYYAPWLFEQLHWEQQALFRVTLLIGLINFVMTFAALFWVDKFGRRWLMLRGLAMMGVSLCLVGFALNNSINQPMLAIAGIFGFIAAYALSIGCLFWIIVAEIYPLNMRNRVMGLASGVHWVANLFISLVFLSILNYLGASWTFGMFAGIMGISWIYCWLKLPETTRLSLEEIEHSIEPGYRQKA